MRWIQKKEDEPACLQDWKVQREEMLANQPVRKERTGTQLWDEFGGEVKQTLKEVLVREQGFLCCYCGSRILASSSSAHLEHLLPKDEFPEKVYDYHNLLASCNGGEKAVVYENSDNKDLREVAQLFGISEADLPSQASSAKRFVTVVPQLKERHCGHKKGNKTIDISPMDPACGEFFKYRTFDGKIEVSEENRQTVELLGLNHPLLCTRREKVIEDVLATFSAIQEIYPEDPASMFDQYLSILSEPDDEGMLRTWFFVATTMVDQH